MNRSDVHHLFPRNLLKNQGMSRGRYNQIANYALTQSEINIAIGDKPPSIYFHELTKQCEGGKKSYGGIASMEELKEDPLAALISPMSFLGSLAENYHDAFLEERRKLMAARIKSYFIIL